MMDDDKLMARCQWSYSRRAVDGRGMACPQLLVFLAVAVTSADAFAILSAAAPRTFAPALTAKMSGSYEPMPEPEPVQKRKNVRTLEDAIFYASSPSDDPSTTCWLDPSSSDGRWVCAPDSVLSGFTTGEESPDDAY